MTALIVRQAEALAAQRRVREAMVLLMPAAQRGDRDALFTLALWQLTGEHVQRDLAAARDLFGRAGAAGHAEGRAIRIAFTAAGIGGPADWAGAIALLRDLARTDPAARDQIAIVDAMDLTSDGAPMRLPPGARVSERPHVLRFDALFTPAECAYLIRAAEPWLQPAVVVDPRTGRQVRDPIRTSDYAAFALATANPAIHALNRRLAAASETDVAQGEPLQILSYRPGQQYRPHHDALAGADNQRVLTALVYLNDTYTGGETRFLRGPLDVRGGVGDAIVFRNAFADGRPDPDAQHAGLPVTAGRKLLASRWIRARPLDLGDKPAAR